jgi:hypothetical protein
LSQKTSTVQERIHCHKKQSLPQETSIISRNTSKETSIVHGNIHFVKKHQMS